MNLLLALIVIALLIPIWHALYKNSESIEEFMKRMDKEMRK